MPDKENYRIAVRGWLDEARLRRLRDDVGTLRTDRFTSESAHDITVFVGHFDQSALHGLLRRLADLGVELLSLQRAEVSLHRPTHQHLEERQ